MVTTEKTFEEVLAEKVESGEIEEKQNAEIMLEFEETLAKLSELQFLEVEAVEIW
jgi:hypothetical protein